MLIKDTRNSHLIVTTRRKNGRRVTVKIRKGKGWRTKPHPFFFFSNRPSFGTFQTMKIEVFW